MVLMIKNIFLVVESFLFSFKIVPVSSFFLDLWKKKKKSTEDSIFSMGEMWFFASKYWRWQIIEIHQIRLLFFPQWYSLAFRPWPSSNTKRLICTAFKAIFNKQDWTLLKHDEGYCCIQRSASLATLPKQEADPEARSASFFLRGFSSHLNQPVRCWGWL